MSRARRARALRAASRPLREHLVHVGIFAAICASSLCAYTGLNEVALALSLAANGVWVFHG